MKQIESKVFIGVRGGSFIFTLMFFLSMSSRIQEKMAVNMVMGLFGVLFAVAIAINYEKGKNWARIWMFIANYGGIVALAKEIADFSELANYSRFKTWVSLGLVLDVAFIIASIYVIVQLHQKKNEFQQAATVQRGDPEEAITKLKNMMDKGMITHEEYEKKKAEVLARM